ncbi:pyridoxamine 5'-phosphate oxidase [Gonapodya prolifera JEL478]|uniref:Pyridoxine-5'-phosphate oxidase n=1 Tax=Gonapodya prolifera (strain JEL478) TaxID=1344416 RepID=A0A139A8N5_GONPJ|nr:pyridoxamine 5'-phosphate oxidase [Gonapodya prolifera JEL478]|eukprot:KXS12815.1 pyridoxamine 5'-phosphate oxidase [Gonapodya prolifera JEL478]
MKFPSKRAIRLLPHLRALSYSMTPPSASTSSAAASGSPASPPSAHGDTMQPSTTSDPLSFQTPISKPAVAAVASNLAAMRIDYNEGFLLESNAAPDPFTQFASWFAHAKETFAYEANAMTLSTAGKDGQPSSRVVLLKGFDEEGFVFYTNYESRKAHDLEENPKAALSFWWGQRQVRIEGAVVRVPGTESDEYFASRPRGSRIGAWASAQSTEVSREELERKAVEYGHKFGEGEVPRPDFWGGYRVIPNRIEFWQGRPSRLHDRLVYESAQTGATGWKFKRLSP